MPALTEPWKAYEPIPGVVTAIQWMPGDPEQTGAVIGTLMAWGYAYACTGGTGDKTVLTIETGPGDWETAKPGDWIVVAMTTRGVSVQVMERTEFLGRFRESQVPGCHP